MNIQQAGLLLEKINGLHKSISLDEGDISSIEKDLMMSYIRQLYEAYTDPETVTAPKVKTVKKKAVTTPSPKPVIEEKPAPQPVAAPSPPPPAPKVIIKEVPAPAPKETIKVTPAIEALFGHKAAKELSEKLSQQNISDLTKALSINDKLLYANELFGRDMSSMNTVLGQLNTLPNMEEAKALLVGIAVKHDWADGEKAEVAESFIKLIRRRY